MLTNAQLWVVIAVPSVLALIGILLNRKGVSDVKADLKSGLEAVNHRLERVEDRLLKMLVDHEQRITRVETRLESK